MVSVGQRLNLPELGTKRLEAFNGNAMYGLQCLAVTGVSVTGVSVTGDLLQWALW